ncbi:MAG TPA: hypothetical protein VEO01_40440 [Pseudonocardiaceae bacterium]|nr:hypothetical protein [Pseudonocardiaceae bacterium]
MDRSGRGPKGRFVRTADTAERDAEAARLRARGQSYRAIAAELGYVDHAGARKAVQRALVAIVAEPAEEVRALQLEQLDRLALAALGVLERNHVTVSHGRIIRDDNEQPILDDGPVLTAIDRLLKIQERRAKLLGLDAPARHEVVTLDALDDEIERLTAELGRTAPSETPAVAGPAGAEA